MLWEKRTPHYIDEWVYDFGKNRFIHFLLFVDGELSVIHRGGYGFKKGEDSVDKETCSTRAPQLGVTKYEILKRCGEPELSEKRLDEIVTKEVAREGKESTEVRDCLEGEEWSYDFGPDRFTRRFYFLKGRLKKTERGDCGVEEE